jgi:hypothetical protein
MRIVIDGGSTAGIIHRDQRLQRDLLAVLERHSLFSKVVLDLTISLPALFAGSMPGMMAFRNINEAGFRRTVLVVLLLSGGSLAFA